MQLAALGEPTTSTDDRADRRAEKDASVTTHVAAASSGKICAEKLKQMVFAPGRTIGWVVGFLSTATSDAFGVQRQPQQQPEPAKRIAALWEDVQELESLSYDWNGYGSEKPNEFARDIAQQILLSATTIIVPNVWPLLHRVASASAFTVVINTRTLSA